MHPAMCQLVVLDHTLIRIWLSAKFCEPCPGLLAWRAHTDSSLVQMSLCVSVSACIITALKAYCLVPSICTHVTGPRADKGERENLAPYLTVMVHDLLLVFIAQDKEAVVLRYPDMEACAQASEQERLQG